MNQTMLFMSYRAASKTILSYLGIHKDILVHYNQFPDHSQSEKDFKGTYKGNFLAATNPPDTCPVIFRRDASNLNNTSAELAPNFSNVLYWTRLENSIHSTFDISNLLNLNGNWKFIFIIRDGRNQIDSWMSYRGARRPTFLLEEGLFEKMCYGWKHRAQLAKALMENADCQVIKFEDLVQNPNTELANMLSSIGLSFDQNYLDLVDDRINSEQTNNSNRWEGWTQEKIDIFNSIAQEEMEYFNYI